MTVSGKRAGTEFTQSIQAPLVNVRESSLPGCIVGPLYQIISPIVADAANPAAIARNADGDVLLYDGEKLTNADDPGDELQINLWSDPTNRTGAIALQSLIDNSLVLPNSRTGASVASDPYLKVYLNQPGTDTFVELQGPGTAVTDDFNTVVNGSGETIAIVLKPGILDDSGVGFSSIRKAQVLLGIRVLRRDWARKALKTGSVDFDAMVGNQEYGEENPAAFAMQTLFKAAPNDYAYLVAVDEVSDSAPEGTYGSYQRALEVAATADVYGVKVCTYDADVQNLLKSHVLEMSLPENRKERRGVVGRLLPTAGPNVVVADGVGDLKQVAPNANITGTGYDIFLETVRRGAALNSNATVEIVDAGGPSAATIEYAGLERLLITTGDTAVGSSVITAVASSPIVAGAVVGDFVRFERSATGDTVAATQTITDTARNFKTLGVKVNSKIVIGGNRYAVSRIMTGTNPFDTLEVVPVGASPALANGTGTAYTVTVDTEITALTATTATVKAVFDTATTGSAVTFVDNLKLELVIDLNTADATKDSQVIVDLINADIDAPQYFEAFVGPAAVSGVSVPATAPVTFANGSNDYCQFFTSLDISTLTLSPMKYLDLASENRDFRLASLRSYNGSVVIEAASTWPQSADLTGLKTSEAFSIYEAGAALTITTPMGTEPDLQQQAETLALFPSQFASRRIISIWPDAATIEANGVTIEVDGHYLGATLLGLWSSLFPEQGHSELPIPSWKSLIHSNDYFKESQLEILSGAGWWVYVQDVAGGPIVCRKQYTTDVSGDLTAEASFTTIADNFQRDVRASVRPLLGVNNITPQLVDQVRLTINGVITRYKNRTAVQDITLNSLAPSTAPGDKTTLEADTTITFFGPFNLLRMKINLQ